MPQYGGYTIEPNGDGFNVSNHGWTVTRDTLPREVRGALQARLKDISRTLQACRREINELESEEKHIFEMLSFIEQPVKAPDRRRPCHMCGAMTHERFGTKAQCAKHTKSMDSGLFNILDEMAKD